MEPVSRRGPARRSDRYDAIVVGAGPAGSAAALAMARVGLQVVVVERSSAPGQKNASGGLLSERTLAAALGEKPAGAPLERRIAAEQCWLLGPQDRVVIRGDTSPGEPRGWSISRTRFDPWFASRAKAAGARLLTGTIAEQLVVEDGRVAGVVTEGEDLVADLVIVCEGLGLGRGLLDHTRVQGLPLRPPLRSNEVFLAVSEVIPMAPATIESRFGCETGGGAAIRCHGDATRGLPGVFSLITNAEAVSVSGGVLLSELVDARQRPHELLEAFKRHPAVAPLLAGGETVEFSSRLIPVGRPDAEVRMYGDGFLACGDAALFPGATFRDGCDLALESGRLAGETVVGLLERGQPPTARHLREYAMRMRRSPLLGRTGSRLEDYLRSGTIPGGGDGPVLDRLQTEGRGPRARLGELARSVLALR
jgi:electron transfer flavoprotein-quinone oxidoreductase